ncbi:hypothetical protein [Domibacillus iocasae]|uniref:Pyridoxamine 5'-phosphate oxidase putative domain-containing protein n=1 Tax=Domibacillus iocasae TaxID=1714016 RepID=A0A1E7DLC8_9BACI|nr:hypothetical protein [Domibacillus iocasae]OES43478.1 hypothetical protein BA724_13740 [Domibacillus iocasae]
MIQPGMPEDIVNLLNGKDLETKQTEAMMLLSVGEDMWPHTAMISVGEIISLNHKEVRLALWPGTATISNILRTGKATLVVVLAEQVHYLRLSLQKLPLIEHAKHVRERFSGTILFVKTDKAKYADITSGIKIQLKDSHHVIQRWNEVLDELVK